MGGKKKVSEMSVDEFLDHGFDSDVEDEDEEKNISKVIVKKKKPKKVATTKPMKKRSESLSHKKQLGNLKDKDPEFYKFLQENDSELLEFSGSDNEGSVDAEENQKGEEANLVKDYDTSSEEEDAKLDDSDEDEEKEDDDGEEKVEKTKPSKIVTHDMIKTWKASLENESIKTLKIVMAALSSAVKTLSPEEIKDDNEEEGSTQKKNTKYVVDGGSLFNSLVTLCLKYSFKILEKYLSYSNGKNKKKKPLPSSSKNWGSVKSTVKQYLFDILQLLRQLAEPTVLTIVLRHCQSLSSYFATFPKLSKMLLKRLVRMWSTADEHVRVLAFLGLRKIVILLPNLFEYTLKKLYLAFVRNSKFVTLKTKPLLQFMENSLVEILSMDLYLTYQQAFVYIRQLAIHLRSALTTKKKDSYQAVYNWQYINCLQLWCAVISELYGDVLKPLVYPLVQIILGVIRLIPSTRYYPLRFTCIKLLNKISEKTGVYIPTASYILEAIEAKEFQRKPSSSEKPPELSVVLKLTKPQLLAKGCQDAIIDLAFETLLEYYVIYSNSIGFPELVFPICHRLKKLTKTSKVTKLCRDMKSLIERIQSHAETVTKARALVTFSPKAVDEVRQWENDRKLKSNSLKDFQNTWKHMQTRVEKKDSENDASVTVGNKRKSSKTKTLNNEGDTSPKKKKTTLNKQKQVQKNISPGNVEDVIEDFCFSDDE